MKPDMLNVLTDDKKYRVVQDGEGRLYALRYDEPWRELVGDNLVLKLAQDLDNARTRLAKIAEALQLDLFTVNLSDKEIEELRTCIATEMGWTSESGVMVYDGTNMPWTIWRFKGGESQNPNKVPPYTTSIDSIREAAMERFETEQEGLTIELAAQAYISGPMPIWQLTALDWCIAFARTAKIWRYKV